MMAKVSGTVLERLFEAQVRRPDDIAQLERRVQQEHAEQLQRTQARHPLPGGGPVINPAEAQDLSDALASLRQSTQAVQPQKQVPPKAPKIGRNDPCPCGSGKKFKQCHGKALDDDEDQATA
jgi:preprotein translocase subunit SecA